MLATVTALALLALADPPDRKEPPTKDELAAITERGRNLAGYDAAAWHASETFCRRRTSRPGGRRSSDWSAWEANPGLGRRVRFSSTRLGTATWSPTLRP